MDKELDKAKLILKDYLATRKMRKTMEREAILEYMYSFDKHFDIEMLREKLSDDKAFISRATLYNTVQLFLDAHLITRHPYLKEGSTRYFKSISTRNRFKMICLVCGTEKELKGVELEEIVHTKKGVTRFAVDTYSLFVFGECTKCQRRKNKKTERNN